MRGEAADQVQLMWTQAKKDLVNLNGALNQLAP
jgi:hypothetical protein